MPGTAGASGADAASCISFDAHGARLLSQMGLYSNILAQQLASGVIEYEPAYALWSDGSGKRRFALFPANAQIQTSDMDHWQFPVGTRFFKEFALGGKRLETRVIERTAAAGQDSDYTLASFIWSGDGCDAVETPQGASDVLGTTHDVPNSQECAVCHGGESGRVLGFSAIQLSKADLPLTLTSLAASGRLTEPPPAGVDYPVPGDAATAEALGYLHANCGHCHNPNGAFPARFLSMDLRLNVAERAPQATTIWKTAVNARTQWFFAPGIRTRIAAGQPGASAIPFRMSIRGNGAQMPPLGTEVVDARGIAALQAWISSLPDGLDRELSPFLDGRIHGGT